MKRLFKSIIDWVSNMEWEEKVAGCISVLLGIFVVVILFTTADIVPATSSDYEILYGYSEELHNSPETLTEMLFDGKCSVTGADDEEVIIIEFENDECKLYVKYNRDFEIISSSEVDKYIHWSFVLIFSILCFIVVWFIAYLILLILIVAMEYLIDYIKDKLLKIAQKFKK